MKTLLRKLIIATFLLLFCTTFVKAEVFYVDTDAYGTPVAVSKSDGTTVWESDYYPFGELYRNTNNQKPNNRRLIGKEKDQETGLTYFGARYYDEALARFGSVDPWTSQTDYAYLTNPQRLNRYVYGMNNPYRYVDPDGRMSKDIENGINPFEMTEGYGVGRGGGFASSAKSSKSNITSKKTGKASKNSQKLLPAPKPRGNLNKAPDHGTIYVDPKGNALVTPKGGKITGSPDGKYIQVRDAQGNQTGVRIDAGHKPSTHPDPRAQQPHGHVPGVTNPDGTLWLPINQ